MLEISSKALRGMTQIHCGLTAFLWHRIQVRLQEGIAILEIFFALGSLCPKICQAGTSLHLKSKGGTPGRNCCGQESFEVNSFIAHL